jgi:hypothetical protein
MAKKKPATKKNSRNKLKALIGKMTQSRRAVFLTGLIGVAIFGGVGAYLVSFSSASVSTQATVVYYLQSDNDDIQGGYKLTDGVATMFTPSYSESVFDVSSDRAWYLTRQWNAETLDYTLVAKSIGGTATVEYPVKSHNCGTGQTSQQSIEAKFDHKPVSGSAPGIYYSTVTERCSDLKPTASSVYHVASGTTTNDRIYNSADGTYSFYLYDVATNDRIAVGAAHKSGDMAKGDVRTRTTADDRYTIQGASNADLSADGKKVVYYKGEYYIANFNGNQPQKLSLGSVTNNVALNSDGTKVIYLDGSASNENKQRLFSYVVSSGKKVNLDTTYYSNSKVGMVQATTWNANGSRILYERRDDVNKKYQIRSISADGSNKETLKSFDYPTTSYLVLF